MTSRGDAHELEWHDIEEHTLTLRGISSAPGIEVSSVTLVAKFALATAESIHTPAAIGFDTTISIHHTEGSKPLQHVRCHGSYASFEEQRAQFRALRDGTVDIATLSLEGLELRVFQHTHGPRSGLCVEGVVSSVMHVDQFPWPQQIGDWLLAGHSSAYALRFAFQTSLVDPPYIDNFIHDMDRLLAHLQLWNDSR